MVSGADQAAHALTLGATAVIEKPAEKDALAKVFADILEAAQRSRKKAKAPSKRAAATAARGRVPELAGRRILIIDDDIRNIYSLTSVLEAHDVKVLHAESGAEGIAILETNPTIDVALVDIMMPDMDGYETMGRIRKMSIGRTLPLIAVTAKAMKGDRQKCLDAGASDYISKPVDTDLLLALLRVWLGRAEAAREAVSAAAKTIRAA